MSIFKYEEKEALGTVHSVDTASVIVKVANIELLRKLQVNRLVALESSKAGQHLVGIVQKIARTADEGIESEDGKMPSADALSPIRREINVVRISLIGTLIDKVGKKANVFRRTLETVPEIDANCFAIEGDKLTSFMQTISSADGAEERRLTVGKYTLDENAEAYLDGDRFFQRHAVIVGSTGSGKSWTTAHLLEEVGSLANANAILFDIHGEYGPLKGDSFAHFRIAGPANLGKSSGSDVIYLPFWLLGYEEMIAMLIDRSDQNAPNQAMVFSRAVINAKKKYLVSNDQKDVLDNFTIDSPVPYSINDVLAEVAALNSEMVPGARGEKQGEFHGKLGRFINRLENKVSDRRLGFMFAAPPSVSEFDWLTKLASQLMLGTSDQQSKKGGIKIIDFSEVPSDILPLIVSLVARIIFSIQQWVATEIRHPIALLCDEAHLYIPDVSEGGTVDDLALKTFERIAKEGRKYGVGLVVISQRPSEVNRTVLSQCNNFIAMRLMNSEDQAVVRRLLPDSLGGFSDLLPVLDVGEALIVGDACLLPSRVRIKEPVNKPNSSTIPFWKKWGSKEPANGIEAAVLSLRRQSQVSKSNMKK